MIAARNTQGFIGLIGGALCSVAGVISQTWTAPYNTIIPALVPILLGWAAWYAPFAIMNLEIKRLTALSKKISRQLDDRDFDLTIEDRDYLKHQLQLSNKRIVQLQFQLFPQEIAEKNIERDLTVFLQEPARRDKVVNSLAIDAGVNTLSLKSGTPPALGPSE